jgi:hypothetical protein
MTAQLKAEVINWLNAYGPTLCVVLVLLACLSAARPRRGPRR